MTSIHHHLSLNGDDWQFKGFLGEEWFHQQAHTPDTKDPRWWRTATVPGSVQHDLWQHGEVPNPHFERNTLLMEWVPQRTWVYRKRFTVDAHHQGKRIQLRFTGVDYEAHFYLNGIHLGDHISMFTPATFEVGDKLRFGEENTLVVVLAPAPSEQPQMGRTSLVHTYKTRMGYWWDFCPRIVHLGIWDDVALNITGPSRIEDVWVRPNLSEDYTHVSLRVAIELSSTHQTPSTTEILIRYNGKTVVHHQLEQTIEAGKTHLQATLELANPRLWWPNGYGDHPLYEAVVRVLTPEGESDTRTVTFGVRHIEWVANEGATPDALHYTPVVNGRKVYIKGWNWVPMDAMYGVEQPQKLEHLITLAQRAHVNLLRVNGVGLIEKEAFYNLCDRLGIMVWQEFILTSSGVDRKPSEDPAYLDMVVCEAEAIIPRRRNHPSLVLWCGGNELEGLNLRPLNDSEPAIAAQRTVVQHLDPDRHWLPTSASGPMPFLGTNTIRNHPTEVHDVHGPWHHQGLTAQYTLYNESTSLLHSEFGAEGLANLRTLRTLFAPENLWPATRDNPAWYHLGAGWWLSENLWRDLWGEISDIETLVQATQFLQAEAVRYAIEANRRRKYRNSGSLPWQFNEPYPMAICTTAVDYYGHPRPLYHAVARAYAPLVVSATFPTQAWAGRTDFETELFALNSHEQPFDATLTARLVGTSGNVVAEQVETVTIQPNRGTFLTALHWPLSVLGEESFFLDLSLASNDGAPLAHNRYLFTTIETLAPLIAQPRTSLTAHHTTQGGEWQITVTNSGTTTALAVWLEDARDLHAEGYIYYSDNHFALLPGERRVIIVQWSNVPANERTLTVSSWNAPTLHLSQGAAYGPR